MVEPSEARLENGFFHLVPLGGLDRAGRGKKKETEKGGYSNTKLRMALISPLLIHTMQQPRPI